MRTERSSNANKTMTVFLNLCDFVAKRVPNKRLLKQFSYTVGLAASAHCSL